MRYETYELNITDSLKVFEFISVGPKGSITKRVQFTKISDDDFYNLAFGDVNAETDDIDDTIVSNNNDMEKVLATVAATVFAFIDAYPEAMVYVKGSNLARNRLYRMSIANNLEEINNRFIVLGLLEDKKWVVFEKNTNYQAFLIIKIQ